MNSSHSPLVAFSSNASTRAAAGSFRKSAIKAKASRTRPSGMSFAGALPSLDLLFLPLPFLASLFKQRLGQGGPTLEHASQFMDGVLQRRHQGDLAAVVDDMHPIARQDAVALSYVVRDDNPTLLGDLHYSHVSYPWEY